MVNRLLPLFALSVLALTACNDAPPPKQQAPAPIVQGNRLRFSAGHPQLALLKLTAAAPATSITLELPAKLVWNEERTQRTYPAFPGRVMATSPDVGQRLQAGGGPAQLPPPPRGLPSPSISSRPPEPYSASAAVH